MFRFIVSLVIVAAFSAVAPIHAQIVIGGDAGGGAPPSEVPFIIEGGHILLDVMLDGSGPYAFYFDTGASNLVTPEVAQELNLESRGVGYVVGFGKAHPAMRWAKIGSTRIDTLSLTDEGFSVAELPNNMADRGKRPRLAGLIGGNLLQRYAAQIDFDRKTIRFIPGGAFSYTGNGRPIDLALTLGGSKKTSHEERPFLPITLDSTATSLLLDTGSGNTATIYPDSALARQLLAKPGSHLHLVGPGGIGGVVAYDMMRADDLQIADLPGLAEAPFVTVITDGMGYKPNTQDTGVLGLSTLGMYNFTIDYPHNRIYLEPRARFAGKLGRQAFRGTGLELTKDRHDRFSVIGVIAGSSAEQAGVAVGDEIFAVNGQPAADLALFDAKAAEVKPISVTLGPEGRQRTISLEPRVLLP